MSLEFLELDFVLNVIASTRFSLMITDKVRQIYTIRLSRADYHNDNDRSYIADTMAAAAADPQTQENIALGLMVGHVDHPEPIFDDQGNVVAYHPSQKQKAFWFRKLWYVTDTKELLADIEPMPTNAGKQLDLDIKAKKPVKFSLRAMGDCEIIDGEKVCSIDAIDGGDRVETPALKDAEVLAANTISDSVISSNHTLLDTPNKKCCNNCKQNQPCCNKTISKPLGDKVKTSCISSNKLNKTLKLGDAKIMNTAELLAKIAAEPDEGKRQLMAEMAAMFAAAEPMLEAEEPEKKDPPVDPIAESKIYEDAKFLDAVNKRVDAKLKSLESKFATLEKVEAKDKAQSIKDSITDSIKAIELAGEFDGRKLENYSEEQLTDAFELAKEKGSVEAAKQSLTDSFKILDRNRARDILFGNIKLPNGSDLKGATTVVTDATENAVNKKLALFDKAIGDYDKKRFNASERQQRAEYRKINKEFTDALLTDFLQKNARHLQDFVKRSITDTANLITASDLRNQEGVFALAMMMETFQNLTALQYVDTFGPGAASGNLGRQFKIPVKMFTDPAAGTTRRHLAVRAGEAYGESGSGIRYNKFYTQLRGIAFRLGEELEHQLESGPVQFKSVAELTADNSAKVARETDSMILSKMQHSADQFQAIEKPNEAVAAAEWTGDGLAGAITVDVGGDIGEVTYGSNVYFAAKLLTGYLTGYTGHPRPIVEPEDTLSIDDNNLETFTDDGAFPVTIATLGGITQVRGQLDSDGNIAALIPGTTPTYAIDNENGVIVFKDTPVSGADAAVRPTISYWYVTNCNEFNLTPRANVAPENHYSGLIRLIQQMAGIMASAPRYAQPDLCLMHTSIGMGAYAIADLFENQRSPKDLALAADYASGDVLGVQPGLVVCHSNGQFFAGARRGYVGRRGSTSYAVSKAMQVRQSAGGIVPANTTRVLPTPENVWYANVIDVAGTPTLIDLSTGRSKKHPARTIRFVGELSSTASS